MYIPHRSIIICHRFGPFVTHKIILQILANGTARSSEASVQLHIQNVDDNRPLFTNRSYKAVIVENAKNGSMVLTIHVSIIRAFAAIEHSVCSLLVFKQNNTSFAFKRYFLLDFDVRHSL